MAKFYRRNFYWIFPNVWAGIIRGHWDIAHIKLSEGHIFILGPFHIWFKK